MTLSRIKFLQQICCRHLRQNVRDFNNCTLKIARAGFHCSSNIFTSPKYSLSENNFAHDVLQNLPSYKGLLADIPVQSDGSDFETSVLETTDWDNITPEDICSIFKAVSQHSKLTGSEITEECYKTMCLAISKRCSEMSDEQLMGILRSLSLWPFCNSPLEENFYKVWKSVDNACYARGKSWDINKAFLFADLWYNLRLGRQSDYFFKSVTSRAKKASQLTPHQLVQLLFYLNVLRKVSKSVSVYDLEHALNNVVNQLSIEEIGVAVMGFFKTQHCLHNPNLIEHIMDRITNEVNKIPEITLSCLLKILRNRMPVQLWQKMQTMLDAIEPEMDRLSIYCCIHIALVTTGNQILHEKTLGKVAQKLLGNIKDVRIKDMEKVIFPLTLFNFDPKLSACVYTKVAEELCSPERIEEIEQHPKCLAANLQYLTQRGIFVEPLISKVLDLDLIRKVYGKTNFMIGRDIICLDIAVGLECPSYKGNRLPVEISNYLTKRYSQFLPDPQYNLTKHAKFMLDVIETFEAFLGKGHVTFKYIVPSHPRADIVFSLDSENNPAPIPEDYLGIEHFTGTIRAPEVNKWHAVIVASRNMFITGTPVLTGENQLKLKQLKLLGYKPLVVSSIDWPQTNPQKIDYLKKLIFG